MAEANPTCVWVRLEHWKFPVKMENKPENRRKEKNIVTKKYLVAHMSQNAAQKQCHFQG